MKKKKIIIVRPRAYAGGTLVLSEFCRLLRLKGYDARIFYVQHEPLKDEDMKAFWKSWCRDCFVLTFRPILLFLFKLFDKKRFEYYLQQYQHYFVDPVDGVKEQRLPFFSKKNTIVVYPEKIYGNFLKAKNVVRWLLYYNPYKGDEKAYGKDDFVIAYRDVFNDPQLNPDCNVVNCVHFDNKLYRRFNFGERHGNCYIIRKGKSRKDLPQHFDGPIIDDLPEEDKVRIFNKSKYCYSYDLQTFYSSIAAYCGCISVVVFEPGKKATDYYSQSDLDSWKGFALGNTPEAIQRSIDTRDDLIRSLNFEESNSKNVDKFIKLIEKKFK